MTDPNPMSDNARPTRSLRRTASEVSSSDWCNDPGGFGRALRSRDHNERLHQDTGFFGSFLGWESGSCTDISTSQNYGHQWRFGSKHLLSLDANPTPDAATQFLQTCSENDCVTDTKDSRGEILPALEGSSHREAKLPSPAAVSEEPFAERVKNECELRNARETWKAIEDGYYVQCQCPSCQERIFCIQDAKMVHCPKCKEVSPLQSDPCAYGVGLGFSRDY